MKHALALLALVALGATAPATATTLTVSISDATSAGGIPSPASAPRNSPGLYVSVIDGAVNLTNKAGSRSFAAGQFGFIPTATQIPAIVPVTPGMKFTPPPVFNSASAQVPTSRAAAPANSVDCEVR